MARHKGPRKPPALKKPPLTHFLCLPLVTAASKPQLETSLAKFRHDVCGQQRKTGEEANKDEAPERDAAMPMVHPKAIRPVGALHCTVGVMSLDRDKLSEAIDFLTGIDTTSLLAAKTDRPQDDSRETTSGVQSSGKPSLERPISPPKIFRKSDSGPLTIYLKGLISMHPPHMTSILYTAPDDATERLYAFCVTLQKLFRDQGFLVEDNRQLKLHATIVNTIYAKGRKQPRYQSAKQQTPGPESVATHEDRSFGHGPAANAPLKMDATAMLERYKDFVWAQDVVLDRVAICEMGAKKFMDHEGNVLGEEYTEVASTPLPR